MVSLPFAESFSSKSAATSRLLGLGHEYCGVLTNPLATQITDASGRRIYAYDQYGSLNYERSFYGDGDDTFAVNEEWDSYGRSIGYQSRKSGSTITEVNIGYAEDGRIESASFRHGGAERKFTYGYLAGSNLLQSLAMPNKVTLTQTWEEERDLHRRDALHAAQ